MQNKNTEISDIIFKHLINDLSSAEERVLNDWLKNPNNKMQFDRICHADHIDAKFEKHDQIDVDKDWARVANKTTRKIAYKNVLKYAAAIFLPISVFLTIYYTTEKVEFLAEADIVVEDVVLGDQPILITNDGTQHLLESNDTILIVDEARIQISADDVNYNTIATNSSETISYNTLKTPKGVKYKLKLNDGTVAWLNAESSLRYPVKFIGKQREVFLEEGEVYFDVTKNKEKPFIVNFDQLKVEVLGTEFNVKAYKEEDYKHVTLVEGSVSIANDEASVVLKPNQQAVIDDNKAQLSVDQVNTDFYTAWKNDLFMYKQERLETIIRDLERQYDMEIFYESQSLKERTFSMRIKKPASFTDVLDYIAATKKVSFQIKDNTVIVKKGMRW